MPGPVRQRFLIPLLFLLAACTTPPDIPPWFDGIHRYPVKQVTVKGARMAYLDRGQGPAIILIHGFGGSLWQWEHQQDDFAGFRLITVDMPGSGFSDKPDIDYTPDEMLERFIGFMDALGIAKATVVGNSLGAGVAEAVAIRHPERIDKLVLIDGLPAHVRERVQSRYVKRALDTRLPAWLVSFGNFFLGRGVTKNVLQEVVYDQTLLTPAVLERSYRNRKRPGLIAPALSLARSLPLWEQDLAGRLNEIRHPTLIIWGEKDAIFPVEVGHELKAMIAGSRLEIVRNAGHIPQWERPDEVNALLRAFVSP